MEKRSGGSGGGGRDVRRLGLVCLGVSLGGCLALALALACLEVSRREELALLRAQVEAMALESADVRRALENVTMQLISVKQTRRTTPTTDDYYDDEYYDEEDDSYYDEDPVKTPQGRNASRSRGKRSVGGSRYQVRIAKGKMSNYNNPTPVQARIYVEKNVPSSYAEFKRSEDQVVRKNAGDFAPKAVHYGGDTSHFSSPWPHHYKGNSRMYHPDHVFKHWRPSHWVSRDSDFIMDNHTGKLTVDAPGLYYVYAQIYYDTTSDTSGFWIIKNDMKEFQCTVTAVTPRHGGGEHEVYKRNSCYTGGLLRLMPRDRLWLREVEGRSTMVHEKMKSFFGMFRVAAK